MLYKIINNKRKHLETIKGLENEEGNIVFRESEITEVMKNHFDRLLNGPSENDIPNEENTQVFGIEEPPITWLEVENSLKSMKNGKSAGVDEVSADMMKAAGVYGIHGLVRILNVIWGENKIPQDWRKGIIVPIFKAQERNAETIEVSLCCHMDLK